jgi:hypothetical protein
MAQEVGGLFARSRLNNLKRSVRWLQFTHRACQPFFKWGVAVLRVVGQNKRTACNTSGTIINYSSLQTKPSSYKALHYAAPVSHNCNFSRVKRRPFGTRRLAINRICTATAFVRHRLPCATAAFCTVIGHALRIERANDKSSVIPRHMRCAESRAPIARYERINIGSGWTGNEQKTKGGKGDNSTGTHGGTFQGWRKPPDCGAKILRFYFGFVPSRYCVHDPQPPATLVKYSGPEASGFVLPLSSRTGGVVFVVPFLLSKCLKTLVIMGLMQQAERLAGYYM